MQQLASQAKANRSPAQLKLAIEVRKLWMVYEAGKAQERGVLLAAVIDALSRDKALLRMEGMAENLLDAPKLCGALVPLLESELSAPAGGDGRATTVAERLAEPRVETALILVSLLARNPAYVGMVSSGGALPLLARVLHELGVERSSIAPPAATGQLERVESSLASAVDTLKVATSHKFAVAVLTGASGRMGGGSGGTALARLFALLHCKDAELGADSPPAWPPAVDLQRFAREVVLRVVANMEPSTAKYLHARGCVHHVVSAVQAAADTNEFASPDARLAAVALTELVTAMLVAQSQAEGVWPQLLQDFGEAHGYEAFAALACAGSAAGRSAPSRDVAAAAVATVSGLVGASARFRHVEALRCLLQIFRDCRAGVLREQILKELHGCLEGSPDNYSAMVSALGRCPLLALVELQHLQPMVHQGVMELLGYVAIVLEETPSGALQACTGRIVAMSQASAERAIEEFVDSDAFKNIVGVVGTMHKLLQARPRFADVLRAGGLLDAILMLLGAFVDDASSSGGSSDPGEIFTKSVSVLLALLEGEGRSAQGSEGECGQVLVLCMRLLAEELVSARWARRAALRCLRQLIRIDGEHAVTYVNVLVSALPTGATASGGPCSLLQVDLSAASELLRTVAQHCAGSSGSGDSRTSEDFRRAFVECGGLEKLLVVTSITVRDSQDGYSSAALLRDVLTALSALTCPEKHIRGVLSTHGYYSRLGATLSGLREELLTEALDEGVRIATDGHPLAQKPRIVQPEMLVVVMEALRNASPALSEQYIAQVLHLVELPAVEPDECSAQPSLSFLDCIDFDRDRQATSSFAEHLREHSHAATPLEFLQLTHEFRRRFGGQHAAPEEAGRGLSIEPIEPIERIGTLLEGLKNNLALTGSSRLNLAPELVQRLQQIGASDGSLRDLTELLEEASKQVSAGLQEPFAIFRGSAGFRKLLQQRACALTGQYCAVNKEALCTAGAVQSLIRVFGMQLLVSEHTGVAPVVAVAHRLFRALCAHRMPTEALRLVCRECARQKDKVNIAALLCGITCLQRDSVTWPSFELCHAVTGNPNIRCEMSTPWPPASGYAVSSWVCINHTDRNGAIHLCSVGTSDAPFMYNAFRIEVQKGEAMHLVASTNSERNVAVFDGFDFAASPGWHHVLISHQWRRIGSSTATMYVDGSAAGNAVRIPFPSAAGLWSSASAPIVHLGTPPGAAEPGRSCWVSMGNTLVFNDALSYETAAYIFLAGPDFAGWSHREHPSKFLSHAVFARPDVLGTVAARAQAQPSNAMSTLRQYGVIGGSDLNELPAIVIPEATLTLTATLAPDGTGAAACSRDTCSIPILASEETFTICPKSLAVPLSELGGIQLVLAFMERAKTESDLFSCAELLAAVVHGGGTQVEAEVQRDLLFTSMLVVLKPKASMLSDRVVHSVGKISGVAGWFARVTALRPPPASFGSQSGVPSDLVATACTLANHKILFPLMAFIWLPFPSAVQSRVLRFFIHCVQQANSAHVREFNVQRLCKVRLLDSLLMLLDSSDSDSTVGEAVELIDLLITTPLTMAVDRKASRESLLHQLGSYLVSTLPDSVDTAAGRSQTIRNLILMMLSSAIAEQLQAQQSAAAHTADIAQFVGEAKRAFHPKWILSFIDPVVDPSTVVLALGLLRQLHLSFGDAQTPGSLTFVYERLGAILPSFGRSEEVYGALLAMLFGEEVARPYALQPATWMYDWHTLQIAAPEILPVMLHMVRGILAGEAASGTRVDHSDAIEDGADAAFEGDLLLKDVGLWTHAVGETSENFVYVPRESIASTSDVPSAGQSSPGDHADGHPVLRHDRANPFCFEPSLIGSAVLMEGPLRISGTGTAVLNCAIIAKRVYFEMRVVTAPCRFRVGLVRDKAIELDALLTDNEYIFTEADHTETFDAGDTVGIQFDQTSAPATVQFFVGGRDPVKVLTVHDGDGPWPALSVSAGCVELIFDSDRMTREAPVGFKSLVQEAEATAEQFLSQVVAAAKGRVEVAYMYENQRKLMGNWSSSYLQLTDRPQWSTADGLDVSGDPKDFFRTLLTDEEHWVALTGWSPAPIDQRCDDGGWEYADQFLAGSNRFRPSPSGFPLVRRRKLQRLRCLCRGNLKVAVDEEDIWTAWKKRLSASSAVGGVMGKAATDAFGSQLPVPASQFPLLAKWSNPDCAIADCTNAELQSSRVAWQNIMIPRSRIEQPRASPLTFDTWHGDGAPSACLTLLRTMLQEISNIRAAALHSEVTELLVDVLFTATRSATAGAETVSLMQTPLQLLAIECICLIVVHAVHSNASHDVLREALAVSIVHTRDERLQSVYYTRTLSYLMNFFSNVFISEQMRTPETVHAAQKFVRLTVDRLLTYQLVVQDCAGGIIQFIVHMLGAPAKLDSRATLDHDCIASYIDEIQQCMRDVVVFQLNHRFTSMDVASLVDTMLLHRDVVMPAVVANDKFTLAMCFHVEPLLHIEDMSIVAVQFFKQLIVNRSAAFAKMLVHRPPPEGDSIGHVDLLHGGFDTLLRGTAAFQEWYQSNSGTFQAVLANTAPGAWQDISTTCSQRVAETAKDWSSACKSVQTRTHKRRDALAVRQRDEAVEQLNYVKETRQRQKALLQQYKVLGLQQHARVGHEWKRTFQEISSASGIVADATPLWRLDFTVGPSRMRKKLRQFDTGDTAPTYEPRAGSKAAPAPAPVGPAAPDLSPMADRDARARLQQLSYSYDEVDDNDVEDDEDAAATAQQDGGADGNVDDTEAEDLGAHEGTAAAADDPVSSQLDHDERILHKWNCARVHGMDHVEGVFLVCSSNFYCWDGYHIQPDGTMVEVAQPAADVPKGGWSFQQDATDSGEVNDDELPPDRCHIPGEGASVSIPHKLRKWSYTSVREVHKRRYQLRLTGLEFFSIDGDQGDLVIFPSAQNVVSQVYKAIMKRTGMPHNDQFGIRDDELRESGATEMTRSGRISRLLRTFTTRWQQGSMSNFEYLMRLNTMAHRSYNDLTQYPVFPWVLADYTSDELDLDDPRVYRDLSKPMGALTEPRRSRFKERFDSWADDDPIPAFHYGSHYSSSATVLHYLIRLEPFTQHSYELQSGRFDIADRLFFSVQEAWESASQKNMSDVKELVPELYYMPEVLENANNVEFGQRLNGSKDFVGAVELPPWARGDARLFVRKMRQALESEFVSSHLHEWIDLIFGYKQLGKLAEESLNVFYYLTYEGMVDMDSISDPMERRAKLLQINSFGQTPALLFNSPHPPRTVHNPRIEIALYTTAQQLEIKPRGRRGVIGYDLLSKSGHGIGDLLSFGHSDSASAQKLAVAGRRRLFIPLRSMSAGVGVGGAAASFQRVHCHVLAWGFRDRTLRVYSLSDAAASHADVARRPLRVYSGFSAGDTVTTAVAISRDGRLMATGGSDGVLCLWEEGSRAVSPRQASSGSADGSSGGDDPGPGGGGVAGTGFELKKRLFGHAAPLTALSICESYAVIASGDSTGCVCLWDTNRRQLVRRLQAGAGCCVHGTVRAIAINHASGDIVTSVATEPISHGATIGADGETPRNVLSVWTVNGSLVAQRVNLCDARGGGGGDAAICCLAVTEGPEWLDTNLVVSGHTDGSVRLWSVVPRRAQQPTVSQAENPDAGCTFELMLRRRVRAISGQPHGAPASPSARAGGVTEECGHGAEVTKILIDSDPFVRTMYTADADGELLQWELPPASGN